MKKIIIALSMFYGLANAAPFCAVFAHGKQCFYYDLASCQRAAGSSGACITNDDELKPASGAGTFCVVTSYATQCHYYDAQSCRRAASTQGGVCKVKD